MDHIEFKKVRYELGLSVNALAEILDTNPVSIRRWEMDPSIKNARPPNPIACQVLRWLQEGKLKLD